MPWLPAHRKQLEFQRAEQHEPEQLFVDDHALSLQHHATEDDSKSHHLLSFRESVRALSNENDAGVPNWDTPRERIASCAHSQCWSVSHASKIIVSANEGWRQRFEFSEHALIALPASVYASSDNSAQTKKRSEQTNSK